LLYYKVYALSFKEGGWTAMKRLSASLAIAVLLFLLLSPTGVSAAPPGVGGNDASFSPDQILVKFSANATPAEVAEIHRQCGGQVKEIIPSLGVQVVTIPAGKVIEKARAYSAQGKVLYAEPNYLGEAIGTPDDAYFDNQWGMKKVEAPAAWEVTKGSSSIKIAILDTGVDLDHPDLAGKIVANIDFTSSATADDLYGHGTHVAGIAAASTNNGIGVAGLGYSSSIVSVKVLGDDGFGYYSWIAKGITWAADNGAKVINMSLGGTSASSTLEDAVNYAWNKGAIIVAAAGNNGSSTPFYPAYYSNTIAVAATDINDNLASWSDYGQWVDVAAPGVSIYSTLKDNGYGYKSGTSMASPNTAGLAALLYTVVIDSNGNGRLNDEVRLRIETTADPLASTGAGSGRINAYKAVSGSAPLAGKITGKVVDASDGSVIFGATASDGTCSVVTDASGNYAISSVLPGSYTVTASKDGYQASCLGVTVVSGQQSAADFVLAKTAPVVQPMWVESITFNANGKNLGIAIKVVSGAGAVPSAAVEIGLVSSGGQSWHFSGITDSSGIASFVVSKAFPGDYLATVTLLTASGCTWDTASGITSANYTLNASGKSARKN
jgi:thermitase